MKETWTRAKLHPFHVLMFKVDAVPVGVLPVAQNGTLLSGYGAHVLSLEIVAMLTL
jgi:hypothetical protein